MNFAARSTVFAASSTTLVVGSSPSGWVSPPSSSRSRSARRQSLKLPGMELRRWPRKNDSESIRARQDELRGLTQDGEVFWDDLEPFAQATEALTGVAVVPVAVVGPIEVELGEY